jgi:pimeloyl-ACP methyl ester carboxylesterase
MKLLSHEEIRSSEPHAQMLYVLHGIFGAGRNWSSVIRRFVRSQPEWSARLIDLRQHGGSQGFAAPHTIATAARDLHELAQHLGETPAAVLGHSFGGKVALMYARDHGQSLKQVWVIDSTPEARQPEGSAWEMLELIRKTPREFQSRDQLIALLTQFGIAVPTAQWMATNLENQNGVYRWRFDFDAIEQLLLDFFQQDLWDVLAAPPGEAEIHIVKAEQSSVLSPAAQARVQELGKTNGRVFLHKVAGGHWVNAENPEALLSLMAKLFGS